MVVELFLRPGGRVSTAHVHLFMEERYTAVSGRFGLRVGRDERTAELGRTYMVPPGTVHDFWHSGTTDAQSSSRRSPRNASKRPSGTASDSLTRG